MTLEDVNLMTEGKKDKLRFLFIQHVSFHENPPRFQRRKQPKPENFKSRRIYLNTKRRVTDDDRHPTRSCATRRNSTFKKLFPCYAFFYMRFFRRWPQVWYLKLPQKKKKRRKPANSSEYTLLVWWWMTPINRSHASHAEKNFRVQPFPPTLVA